MVTIVSVFVFVIVAIGLSYYCYRVKAFYYVNITSSCAVDPQKRANIWCKKREKAVQLRAENKIAPTDTGSVNGENEKDEQVAK